MFCWFLCSLKKNYLKAKKYIKTFTMQKHFYNNNFYVHFVDEYLTNQTQTSYEFYPYLVSSITGRLQCTLANCKHFSVIDYHVFHVNNKLRKVKCKSDNGATHTLGVFFMFADLSIWLLGISQRTCICISVICDRNDLIFLFQRCFFPTN